MTVEIATIRDLLGRPRGLNDATISEYITLRTIQVNKASRNATFLPADTTNAVTTTEQEAAIKALVVSDCLQVLVDTIPSYVDNEGEKRENDIRLNAQLRAYQQRANELLALISEQGGSAFVFKATKTRVDA